ncbi:MAG: HPP family protein [Alphaproteobacteria bacterium]|nr:HPP family protein [Alphaproteobacteria bacterium]
MIARTPVVNVARAALAAGALILLAGALGAVLNRPWLFPSLGPTAALIVLHPRQRAARPWNTLVGHGVGVLAGIASAQLCGVIAAGAALPGAPGFPHMWAGAAATALTLAGGLLLDADHPPAAATTLLIALGAIPADLSGIGSVAIGVSVVCVAGLPLRRCAQAWAQERTAS